ncbi:hydantoinase/carbamoylase family amidase [Citricoccus sp. GCM10030269]|uniref:hydantoinase/carbamoylase family amidase n=1 Tax=Citricoccus sp. GCM10030269 TaxID=3273388 RepID=UPI00361E6FF6
MTLASQQTTDHGVTGPGPVMPGTAEAKAFLEDFGILSSFGATDAGGVHRPAATTSHTDSRMWLIGRLREFGLEVIVDGVGNVYGTATVIPGAPYVLIGSHTDSQPTSGRFDGAYGVLAAAHAVAHVSARVQEGSLSPTVNLAVVDWFNEEGARFQPSIMGSTTFTGARDAASTLDVNDVQGTSVRQALTDSGFLGDDEPPECCGYAEIHIEQGRILECEGLQIGVVTGGWTATKMTVEVIGAQGHTGATDMSDRHDALVGAARVVLAARAIADRHAHRADRAKVFTAVARLLLEPESPGVIASKATVSVDLRSDSPELVPVVAEEFHRSLTEIAADGEVDLRVHSEYLRAGATYAPVGIEVAEQVADELRLSHRRMLTRAGHDSVPLSEVVPTVMLFVPSVEGVSHHEAEYTHDDDLLRGLSVLRGVAERMVCGAVIDADRPHRSPLMSSPERRASGKGAVTAR